MTIARQAIVARDAKHLKELIDLHTHAFTDACDLNHIDASQVTSMRYLFEGSTFTGDISQWNVSNVTDMEGMFQKSLFNGNIANWNVSNVVSMSNMFDGSVFRGDLSRWNTARVRTMHAMFMDSRFNGDISAWSVGACVSFQGMFAASRFNQDISQWDMSSAQSVKYMLSNTPFAHDVSAWNLALSCEMGGLFEDSLLAMRAQQEVPWHAKLHLDNWTRPTAGLLLQAFDELQSIHDTLECSNEERARGIARLFETKLGGEGATPAGQESWSLDDLLQ